MNNRDLINQYVDSGLQLPEYQMRLLSNSDKSTYIRKRVIAVDVGNTNLGVYDISKGMDMNNQARKGITKYYNKYKN